ncbi:hypothetical protein [Streptacidiphilus sp. EB129]|uniref:PspA-associated protein PspAA n=1 Tax=Streptacidiphilus sp. EB129 TaxID=3156262 RepID=UPI003515A488
MSLMRRIAGLFHRFGVMLADSTLAPSEVVLPDRDMTLAQVADLVSGQGTAPSCTRRGAQGPVGP